MAPSMGSGGRAPRNRTRIRRVWTAMRACSVVTADRASAWVSVCVIACELPKNAVIAVTLLRRVTQRAYRIRWSAVKSARARVVNEYEDRRIGNDILLRIARHPQMEGLDTRSSSTRSRRVTRPKREASTPKQLLTHCRNLIGATPKEYAHASLIAVYCASSRP